MSDRPSAAPAHGVSDRIFPFSVPGLDLRGRTAQFGPAVDAILSRHDYPEPVARLLAEAIMLTALLGSSLKFDGKFIMQTQTDGPVNLLVADLRENGAMRGYARYDEAWFAAADRRGHSVQSLLGKGVLAFTVDQGEHMQRYQGLVELTGQSLQEAAVHYFRQSEQLPTEIRLSVGRLMTPVDGAGIKEEWRAGGLVVQFMPQEAARLRAMDLPGGDAPEGALIPDAGEDDAWSEAKALVRTIEDSELTDPTIGAERLLYRLFNQHDPRLFPDQTVRDECSCSRERIGGVLRGFPEEERAEGAEDGVISVTCEFCSTRYAFTLEEISAPAA
jgi:molecular chaperone Hsp33